MYKRLCKLYSPEFRLKLTAMKLLLFPILIFIISEFSNAEINDELENITKELKQLRKVGFPFETFLRSKGKVDSSKYNTFHQNYLGTYLLILTFPSYLHFI